MHQLLEDRREGHPPEQSIFISFDDDRLAGVDSEQLSLSALRCLVRQCLRNPAGSFSAHRLYLDLNTHRHRFRAAKEL